MTSSFCRLSYIRRLNQILTHMKYGVSRQTLLLTAGLVWTLAGGKVLAIGLAAWLHEHTHAWYFKTGEATLVFLLFFCLIFHRLFRKYTARIRGKSEKNCPFAFFDTRGWLIMAFMMTLGIVVRLFELLPPLFIAVFYTGLAFALIGTGIRFLLHWYSFRRSL